MSFVDNSFEHKDQQNGEKLQMRESQAFDHIDDCLTERNRPPYSSDDERWCESYFENSNVCVKHNGDYFEGKHIMYCYCRDFLAEFSISFF